MFWEKYRSSNSALPIFALFDLKMWWKMAVGKYRYGVRKQCEFYQYWHVVDKRCLYNEVMAQADVIAKKRILGRLIRNHTVINPLDGRLLYYKVN